MERENHDLDDSKPEVSALGPPPISIHPHYPFVFVDLVLKPRVAPTLHDLGPQARPSVSTRLAMVRSSPTSTTQRAFCLFSLFSTTQVIELLNPCTPNSTPISPVVPTYPIDLAFV